MYLQLHLGLLKPVFVTGINDEDYGIECWIIVLQSSSSNVAVKVNNTVSFPEYEHIILYYIITRCYPALYINALLFWLNYLNALGNGSTKIRTHTVQG